MEPEIVTKSQFARLIQRDPAFVTRAIADGKLTGEALVGNGRAARIRVSAARAQLGAALDLGQQLAQRAPILPSPVQPPALGGGDLFAAGDDDEFEPAGPVSSAIQAQREEQIRLRNAKLRQEVERGDIEARRVSGELVEVAAVAAALRRQIGPLAAIFDEMPQAIAKAIAEKHGLDYAPLLIDVKHAIRAQRQAAADRLKAMDRARV